jgi:hypothetical protein
MKDKTTSIQLFKSDKDKIEVLANLLKGEVGGFVSQRVAVMMAVNKYLKELENDSKEDRS